MKIPHTTFEDALRVLGGRNTLEGGFRAALAHIGVDVKPAMSPAPTFAEWLQVAQLNGRDPKANVMVARLRNCPDPHSITSLETMRKALFPPDGRCVGQDKASSYMLWNRYRTFVQSRKMRNG